MATQDQHIQDHNMKEHIVVTLEVVAFDYAKYAAKIVALNVQPLLMGPYFDLWVELQLAKNVYPDDEIEVAYNKYKESKLNKAVAVDANNNVAKPCCGGGEVR